MFELFKNPEPLRVGHYNLAPIKESFISTLADRLLDHNPDLEEAHDVLGALQEDGYIPESVVKSFMRRIGGLDNNWIILRTRTYRGNGPKLSHKHFRATAETDYGSVMMRMKIVNEQSSN